MLVSVSTTGDMSVESLYASIIKKLKKKKKVSPDGDIEAAGSSWWWGVGGRGVEFLCNLTQTCSRTEPHTCYALK